MQTITSQTTAKVIVNKSSFFGYAIPLSSEEEVKEIILRIRKEHKKANHVAYAYRLTTTNTLGERVFDERASDDKEPSKTAGYPLLRLLQQKQLSNTLLVVARVFGGVKLGPAGLIKAYRLAGSTALDKNICIDI